MRAFFYCVHYFLGFWTPLRPVLKTYSPNILSRLTHPSLVHTQSQPPSPEFTITQNSLHTLMELLQICPHFGLKEWFQGLKQVQGQ